MLGLKLNHVSKRGHRWPGITSSFFTFTAILVQLYGCPSTSETLLTCGNRVISVLLGQYHGCWCPGSLRRQDISSHDIEYIEYVGPGLTWGRILSTCVISKWSNDIKCKYMFLFHLNKIACKWLVNVSYESAITTKRNTTMCLFHVIPCTSTVWSVGLRTGMRYILRTNYGLIDILYRRSVYQSKYQKENISTCWWFLGWVTAKTWSAVTNIWYHKGGKHSTLRNIDAYNQCK